jgi:hypothetical protein
MSRRVRSPSILQPSDGAVKWLGFCFLMLFSGFQSVFVFQTSFNSLLGLINSIVFFAGASISLLIGQRIVKCTESITGGLPWVFMIFSSFFSFSIFLNLLSVPSNVLSILNVTSFFLSGISFGILWMAKSEYITRCSGNSRQSYLILSKFNNIFYSFYVSSGLCSGLLSFYLLVYKPDLNKTHLLIFLGLCSLSGSIAFLGLPKRSALFLEQHQTGASLVFMHLVLLIFTHGLIYGVYLGLFLSKKVTPVIGPHWLFLGISMFYFFNSILTVKIWNRISNKKYALILSASLVSIWLVSINYSKLTANFERNPVTNDWRQIQAVNAWDLITVLAMNALIAIPDSFFETQIPALLITASTTNTETSASHKFWQSLGVCTGLGFCLILDQDETGLQKISGMLMAFLLLGLWAALKKP